MVRFCLFLGLFMLFEGCQTNPNAGDTVAESVSLCDCNELSYDQPYNNFYLTAPRDGFTGICEIYYPNGVVSTRKNFKNGKLHGETSLFHENGELAEQKLFDMNLQTGDYFMYDEAGELTYHGKYERGRHVETVFQLAD